MAGRRDKKQEKTKRDVGDILSDIESEMESFDEAWRDTKSNIVDFMNEIEDVTKEIPEPAEEDVD